MIITTIFVIALSWRIARGILLETSTNSSIFAPRSSFKKSAIEIVIPLRQEEVAVDSTIDFIEYLKEKREERQNGKIQKVMVSSLSPNKPADLYLN